MPKTVLIVEDEFLIALELRQLLEEHGWRVLEAASVGHALRLLEDELPSVALLDVYLGKELVTPVAAFLKARDVPFLLTSAYEKPERFAGEVLAGAVNLGKPTGRENLLAALARLAGA